MCFFISVVYIKEELHDAAFDVKIEPVMNSYVQEDEFSVALNVEKYNKHIGTNKSPKGLAVKELPSQDDLVSEC